MKKFKIIALLLAITLLVSCGSQVKDVDSGYDAPRTEMDEYIAEKPAESSKSEESFADSDTKILENILPENRKIILSYNLRFETLKYDESISNIVNLVESNGGYFSEMREDGGSYSRSFYAIAKVPKNKSSKFVESVSNIEDLNIREKSLSSEDITELYTDTELRLKTLKQKLERLNVLSEKQSELEGLIQLEKEISATILEIERIQGQLNSMDSKVDYTDISISINEISTYTTQYTKPSFTDRLVNTFGQSIEDFIYVVEDIILTIVYLLPYIVIIGLFVVLVRFIYRRLLKERFKSFRSNAGKKYRFNKKKEENDTNNTLEDINKKE